MIKYFSHIIPKLSLPSKIAVSKFLSKISFVGYSGKSKVLKLSLKKFLPCMSHWQVFHIKNSFNSDLKVRVKNRKFRATS